MPTTAPRTACTPTFESDFAFEACGSLTHPANATSLGHFCLAARACTACKCKSCDWCQADASQQLAASPPPWHFLIHPYPGALGP